MILWIISSQKMVKIKLKNDSMNKIKLRNNSIDKIKPRNKFKIKIKPRNDPINKINQEMFPRPKDQSRTDSNIKKSRNDRRPLPVGSPIPDDRRAPGSDLSKTF